MPSALPMLGFLNYLGEWIISRLPTTCWWGMLLLLARLTIISSFQITTITVIFRLPAILLVKGAGVWFCMGFQVLFQLPAPEYLTILFQLAMEVYLCSIISRLTLTEMSLIPVPTLGME